MAGDKLIVAVGDIHTAGSFPDSFRHEQHCRWQANGLRATRNIATALVSRELSGQHRSATLSS